nr:YARHG domain-containing protein [uncultured Mucilaginibacter sp.]
MKTKPILIAAMIVLAAICSIFYVGCKTAKTTEKAAIMALLKDFNTQVKAGHTKSALAFFEDGPNMKANKTLIKVLSGKSGISGKGKPLFNVELDVETAGIDFTNPQQVVAVVTAEFKHSKVPTTASHINFTLHKTEGKQYKISAAKVDDFASDYALYQNKVINATVPETDIFSPETLAAFKTAEQLQTKYDSVLWFQHVDKKAWFYVIKGKITDTYYYEDKNYDYIKERSDFKMGLVNPELKEVIPVEYDLIHNIGGTVDGLIEVEKQGKKGFYDMAGKLIVPVKYDQLLPLTDDENLALLKNGSDYFYLKKDSTITDKLVDFKVADILPKVKHYASSFTLDDKTNQNIMEYNSRNEATALVVSPSYLVEWQFLDKFLNFSNPLRKLMAMEGEEGGDNSETVAISYDGEEKDDNNWFQSTFYSVVENYLNGRGDLYESKKLLIVDKKQNRVLGFDPKYLGGDEGGGIRGECRENHLKAINDSLFEYKTTASLYQDLLDSTHSLSEGPFYHYIQIKNGKLVALKTRREFPTQFVKLDDSYLQGCYLISPIDGKGKDKRIDHTTEEILQVMKNEIYASYRYRFKSARWNEVFQYKFSNGSDTVLNDNVDDSLTTIDKYNIDFINRKLKITKPAVVALR